MDSDYVDAQWAKDAVREIDQAIAEFNKGKTKTKRMAVAWGHPDQEEAEYEKSKPVEEQFQHGLLTWGEREFELRIDPPLDGRPTFCRADLKYEVPLIFRCYPREVYNAIHALDPCCQIVLFRRGDSDKIDLFAISVNLVTQNLTASILHDALDRLCSTSDCLFDQNAYGDPDYWEKNGKSDGGDEDLDDEDE